MIGWQASTSHYASYYLSGDSNSNDVACDNSYYSSYNTLVFRLDDSKSLPSLHPSLTPSFIHLHEDRVYIIPYIVETVIFGDVYFCEFPDFPMSAKKTLPKISVARTWVWYTFCKTHPRQSHVYYTAIYHLHTQISNVYTCWCKLLCDMHTA